VGPNWEQILMTHAGRVGLLYTLGSVTNNFSLVLKQWLIWKSPLLKGAPSLCLPYHRPFVDCPGIDSVLCGEVTWDRSSYMKLKYNNNNNNNNNKNNNNNIFITQFAKRQIHNLSSFSDSAINFQYPVVSLRSSSNCLCLSPGFSVSYTFPSVSCFWRKFRR
jgi:hypothetical protein